MKKSYFLSVCGGLMLMGAVAANAQPLFEVGSNGLQGNLAITNFLDGDGQFNISLTQAGGYQGNNNNPATISFSNVATSDPLIYSGNPVVFYHSPSTNDPNNPTGPSVDLFNGLFFQGTSSFTTGGVSSLTFGDPNTNNASAIGQSMTLTLNGQVTIPIAGVPALPINSILTLNITGATSNSLSIAATDSVQGAGPGWESILALIDQGTANTGIIDGIVTVANSGTAGVPAGTLQAGILQVPEPASLALLSAGLIGLGWTRRIKKAA